MKKQKDNLERLDAFNKILLATGTINYMASAIHNTVIQIGQINHSIKDRPDVSSMSKKVTEDMVKNGNAVLDKTIEKLAAIMEDVGNYINAHDIICELDERVYRAPFEIVIHKMDITNENYEGEIDAIKLNPAPPSGVKEEGNG